LARCLTLRNIPGVLFKNKACDCCMSHGECWSECFNCARDANSSRRSLCERVVVPSQDSNPARHWVMGHNNWTQVCHTRTATLRGDGSLKMIDRWSASVKDPLRWQWVTRADVCLQTAGAHFRSKGRAIDLKWKCDARIEAQFIWRRRPTFYIGQSRCNGKTEIEVDR